MQGDYRDSNPRMLEPQSSVLTNFTIAAVCIDYVTGKRMLNQAFFYFFSMIVLLFGYYSLK